MDPKMAPISNKIVNISGSPRPPASLGVQKGVNGAKMVPNCLPTGCQMELKSFKMDPERAPEGFKMGPN